MTVISTPWHDRDVMTDQTGMTWQMTAKMWQLAILGLDQRLH